MQIGCNRNQGYFFAHKPNVCERAQRRRRTVPYRVYGRFGFDFKVFVYIEILFELYLIAFDCLCLHGSKVSNKLYFHNLQCKLLYCNKYTNNHIIYEYIFLA